MPAKTIVHNLPISLNVASQRYDGDLICFKAVIQNKNAQPQMAASWKNASPCVVRINERCCKHGNMCHGQLLSSQMEISILFREC